MTAHGRRRSRPRTLSALAVVVGAGLALQTVRHLAGSDVAGTVLFAVAAVLLVAALLPRLGAAGAATLGAGIALAVEFAQLTPLPGLVVDRVPMTRLVLGSSFDVADTLALLAGGIVAWLLVRTLDGRSRRASAAPST
ncbi:DUF2809 domain-containing protein [Pseudactinotalea sp. HY160]|uniref:DUF2809 domain-containing protein n=1 Tax=Pseudactinotalea sp. HY160 TaxID=2654490 RepID=UPI00128C5266|nr:DUF2809 domain-containing protein [Pseudactinotalea sp. HY160]MPV50539.1 DUF2809 domain-containing protein [Pseudactinotalea sp. HY160]